MGTLVRAMNCARATAVPCTVSNALGIGGGTSPSGKHDPARVHACLSRDHRRSDRQHGSDQYRCEAIRCRHTPRRGPPTEWVPGWAWTALLKFVADDGKIDGVGPL